jgi:drug/metabolite transporter (DMT)-like permease
MIFLIGSIILSSWLTLSFKLVERFGINTFQSIVFNYITCVITGSVVNGAFPISSSTVHESWFGWSLIMGFTFVSLFNVIGFTAQKMGVSVASVANKLSLVIPFIFSIYLYNEQSTALKILGIVVALAAVALTCWPSANATEPSGKKAEAIYFLLPVVLFIGSGLLDTMIKYVETSFLNESNKNAYLITAFAVAATIGLIVMLFLLISGKMKFDKRSIVAGILIGVPNYFSIWCLVRVLSDYKGNSSAIIPINNMGIVLFSTVVAWIMFKEKLSTLNWLGILLSVAAIALIAFG